MLRRCSQSVVQRQIALHVAAAALNAPAAEVHVLEAGQSRFFGLHPLADLLVDALIVLLERQQIVALPLDDQVRVLQMAGDSIDAYEDVLQVQAAKQLRDDRLLVTLILDPLLAQHQPVFGHPGAHYAQP